MKILPLNSYSTRVPIEKMLRASDVKLWNEKIHGVEACWNGAKLNYICSAPMVLSKIFNTSN